MAAYPGGWRRYNHGRCGGHAHQMGVRRWTCEACAKDLCSKCHRQDFEKQLQKATCERSDPLEVDVGEDHDEEMNTYKGKYQGKGKCTYKGERQPEITTAGKSKYMTKGKHKGKDKFTDMGKSNPQRQMPAAAREGATGTGWKPTLKPRG